jgi:phage tail-like protein
MADDRRPYRHLNRDGVWPGFAWEGLTLDANGVLRLMALPKLNGALPPQLSRLASPQPPGGVAIDRDGTIFFTNPATSTVYRIDGCSGAVEPAPCLGGRGSNPTQFSEPSALLIPAHRHVLYVADSGNHRVQVFDLDTMALVDILTGFDRPISLASDDAGNLYVVDTQARRVDRMTSTGDRMPQFWDAVHGGGYITDPRAVACEDGLVYVLDGAAHTVGVFDGHGQLIALAEDLMPATASALAIADGIIYANDSDRGRVAVFRQDRQGVYVYAGDAAGYDGPVSALTADGAGGLLLSPGGGIAPLRLTIDASYRPSGWLWSGPIWFDDVDHYWNRLHARIDLPVDSHVQFLFYTGPLSAPPPVPSGSGDLFPPMWRAAPPDATDVFLTFDGMKRRALWVAARFTNDRDATPALAQLRVEFDQDSYLSYLPAIYRERTPDDVLLRYLSLFESFFDEVEGRIRDLPALTDPAAAPVDALPWLAGFLALSLPETATERDQREAIATAYARYARRGTVAGLRDTLQREANVRVVIDEPLQAMGWWSMPAPPTSCRSGATQWIDGADSILGVNTVLIASEPQGAVVGTTATVDESQLITREEYGSTLFEAVAYRFTVLLYPGELRCVGALERLQAILDREKPAHTIAEVCVISPGIRIGYQARLGIDTLLGGGATPTPLGEGALVLPGQSRAKIGIRSRVGVSTQL